MKIKLFRHQSKRMVQYLDFFDKLYLAASGPGGGHFHGKVLCMLIVFLGYKILILVLFRVFWKILCRNEILVFLGSAHFPYRVKMRSFRKFSVKLVLFRVLHQHLGICRALKSKFFGFSKKFPTNIPITSTLKYPLLSSSLMIIPALFCLQTHLSP